jgi:hypothetical protein
MRIRVDPAASRGGAEAPPPLASSPFSLPCPATATSYQARSNGAGFGFLCCVLWVEPVVLCCVLSASRDMG